MRIVALEEHFNILHLVGRIPVEAIRHRGYPTPDQMPMTTANPQMLLKELGDVRLKDMDEAGISMQILSISGLGADLLPAAQSVPWAREANDYLAEAVSTHPGRYAGFAHLPMTAPLAAADELERCVQSIHFVGALING